MPSLINLLPARARPALFPALFLLTAFISGAAGYRQARAAIVEEIATKTDPQIVLLQEMRLDIKQILQRVSHLEGK